MNVAIIGAGLQGRRHAATVSRLDGCRVVAVCDEDASAANALAGPLGAEPTAWWEEAVRQPGIDVVAVCTPPALHSAIAASALEHGKHVLCEKPLGRNPAEARRIVQAAVRAGRVLKCVCNLRHHPAVVQARRWLDKGRIGTPMFLRCRYGIAGRPGYEKEWRADPARSGGGELMDQGFHVLDLCRWFLGDFAQVFAFVSTAYWPIQPLEDNAFVLLRTTAAQVASVHVSWTQWKNVFSFELFGGEGYVQVEGLGGTYGTERAALGRREFLGPVGEEVIEFRGEDPSWQEEWKEFLGAIREEREPQGNGQDALAVHELVEAAYRSSRQERLVRLKGE
ncbi:MAG: Gfo/Idh/MocA family oxidoreductase [Chloroflexi bacterium]|nr:Gfo/Idh/MocA family oxidoreductase [Chloroflexota bacterium]